MLNQENTVNTDNHGDFPPPHHLRPVSIFATIHPRNIPRYAKQRYKSIDTETNKAFTDQLDYPQRLPSSRTIRPPDSSVRIVLIIISIGF